MEDEEIDFAQSDDLEENTGMEQRRAGTLWGKVLMWSLGIGCALYFGAKLSNWLIGFPASLKGTEELISTIAATLLGMSFLSMIVAFIDSTVKEFRIRFRQIDHRLKQIEVQIESIRE